MTSFLDDNWHSPTRLDTRSVLPFIRLGRGLNSERFGHFCHVPSHSNVLRILEINENEIQHQVLQALISTAAVTYNGISDHFTYANMCINYTTILHLVEPMVAPYCRIQKHLKSSHTKEFPFLSLWLPSFHLTYSLIAVVLVKCKLNKVFWIIIDFHQTGGKIPVACHRTTFIINMSEDKDSSFAVLLVTRGAENILDNRTEIKLKYLNKLKWSAEANKIKVMKV